MSHRTRIPVLDGVRGFAILLVLAVHFIPDYGALPYKWAEWLKKLLQCGWTGVDLFFVLSGLLITDVLLSAKNSPNAVRNFYVRRSLRIWPLYFSAVGFVFLVLPLLPTTDSTFKQLETQQYWLWSHCANIKIFMSGFSSLASEVVTFGHFWSLAVEEQFYLLWPIIVWNIPERRLPYAAYFMICVAIACRFAIQFSSLDAPPHPGLHVLMPCRMDALAIGGLIALMLRSQQSDSLRWIALFMLPVSVTALGILFFRDKGLWASGAIMRTAGLTAVALAYGSAIVLLMTRPQSLAASLIDNPILRFFGKYSYGIYVIHAMIEPSMNRLLPNDRILAYCGSPLLAMPMAFLLKMGLAVALSLVSWHLIEQPCLRLKKFFP